MRSARFWADSRSARHSSVLIVSMSRIGSMEPSTWVMFESSKQRTTSAMASVSRMWLRNLLPRPSPLEAPAHDSGNCFFRFVHVGQDLDAFIRDFYDTDIRFNRAEGIVCRFCAGLGNRVEQCALTDIRQADDAYFQIGTQWLNHLYLNNFKSAMRLTASMVFSFVPKAVRRR